MNRRRFIRLSSGAFLTGLTGGCVGQGSEDNQYEIKVISDRFQAHQLFQGNVLPLDDVIDTDAIIVGGGIAGLAAAAQLGARDYHLFELSDRWGGSSSSQKHGREEFSQGAHYELAYPDYYGAEALGLLERLNVIVFDGIRRMWDFREKQYLIPQSVESICFDQGKPREGVMPEGNGIEERFLDFLRPYLGRMPLPTRLIKKEDRELNEMTFHEYIRAKSELPESLKRAIDYQMIDDYGSAGDQISALAGVHYYTCRPYYSERVELFSPPQGNAYFVQKLLDVLPPEQIHLHHMVRNITVERQGVQIEVSDFSVGRRRRIRCQNVIFAGHKLGLKYIRPELYSFFNQVSYAPWVVLNFVLSDHQRDKSFWQNEWLGKETDFLGFVDSDAQYNPNPKKRVLTAYFCLPEDQRWRLTSLEDPAEAKRWASRAMILLNQMFSHPIDDLVEVIYIKAMGHAMPIPKPGYLFRDANDSRLYPEIVFAGVDNGRLPLFFEALDSGISAAKLT